MRNNESFGRSACALGLLGSVAGEALISGSPADAETCTIGTDGSIACTDTGDTDSFLVSEDRGAAGDGA